LIFYKTDLSLNICAIHLSIPPPRPFDIENLERIEPPWRAIKEWIPDDEPDLD
jgi:hypothetical protein